MGMNPNHVALSIPSEMMPQMVNTLENWKKRGRKLFYEEPHDEEREYIIAPKDQKYVKADMFKKDYVKWIDRLDEPIKSWDERRKEKRLATPSKKHGVC
jgi:hypothetical protein